MFKSQTFKRLGRVVLGLAIAAVAFGATTTKAAGTTIVIESWRTDDKAAWDKIIADFKADNPDIDVKYDPTNAPDYNAALNAKLKAGTAGDIMACRPFDAGLLLYQAGNLSDVTNLKGIEHFSTFARSAWTTDDGKVTYCVPMASVLHGFIYNKDYFAKNNFKEPATYEDFLALLEAIKKEGSIAPLGIGTKEGWTTTSMGFDNIGPNFWGGDAGRKALIAGTAKYNDKAFVSAFDALGKWAPYLPKGHEAIDYASAQGLFTSGKAAIYPSGSWEIAGFEHDADFKMGAFKAPPPASANGKCTISDQLDIALGMNKASKNPEAAQKFLQFVASEKFATEYVKQLPGFFPLADYKIKVDDDLANTFLSWRGQCESTLRSSYQKLSASPDHPTENNLWNVTTQLLQGKMTAQQAGDFVQADLDKWYKPAGK